MSPELGIDSKVMRCSPGQGGDFPAAGQNWSQDKGENIPHFSCKDHGQTGDNKGTGHGKNMVKDGRQSSSKPQSTESTGMLPAAISTELSRDESFCLLIEKAAVFKVEVKVLNHPLAKDTENLVISPDDFGDNKKTIRLFFNQNSGKYEVLRSRKKKPIPAKTLDNAFLMGYYGCEEAEIDQKLFMHLSAKCHHARLKRFYHNIDVPLGYDFTSSAYQGSVGGKVIETRNKDAISSLYRSFEISRNGYTTDSMQEQQVNELKNKVDAHTQELIKESCFPNAISAASASVASDNSQANQAPDVQKASDNESEVPENAYLSVNNETLPNATSAAAAAAAVASDNSQANQAPDVQKASDNESEVPENAYLSVNNETLPNATSAAAAAAAVASDNSQANQAPDVQKASDNESEVPENAYLSVNILLPQGDENTPSSPSVIGGQASSDTTDPDQTLRTEVINQQQFEHLLKQGHLSDNVSYHVKGSLKIGNELAPLLSKIKKLNLQVDGIFDCEGCTDLTSFPEGVSVDVHLNLKGCGLESLPEMEIKGDLSLSNCTRLKSLSGVKAANINVQNCTSLQSLSRIKASRIDATSCTGLVSLSEIESTGSLTAQNCTSLKSLSRVESGDLYLTGCTSLESLSGIDRVRYSLDLSRCTSLKTISGLSCRVGETLNLSGCTSLESISEFSGWVGGNLDLSGCTSLESLPDWVAQLGIRENSRNNDTRRWVYLDNSGLSAEQIAEFIDKGEPRGLRPVEFEERTEYLFSSVRRQVNIGQIVQALYQDLLRRRTVQEEVAFHDPTRDKFNTFNEAFAYWQKLASHGATTSQPSLEDANQGTLRQFLGQLTKTEDCLNPHTKLLLADQIMGIMPLLDKNNASPFREEALCLVTDAITSCRDRATLALHDLANLELRTIAQAKAIESGDSTELKELGRQALNFALVKDYAWQHSPNDQEAIEIELAFLTELRGLGVPLPGSVQKMLYRASARVTNEDIRKAAKYIKDNGSEEHLEKFLSQWDTWLPYQRHQEIPPFDQLEQKMVDTIGECVITMDKAATMVEIDGMEGSPIGYETLCKHYRGKGTNPFAGSVPLDWSKVRRLVERPQ